jgi:hypothetical protein
LEQLVQSPLVRHAEEARPVAVTTSTEYFWLPATAVSGMVHSMAVSLLEVTAHARPAKATAGGAEPKPVPAMVSVEPLRLALVTAAVASEVKAMLELASDVVDSPFEVTVTVVEAAEQLPRAVVHTIWLEDAVTTVHWELQPSRATVLQGGAGHSQAKLVPVTVTVAPPSVDAAAGATLVITELHATLAVEVA